MTKNPQGEGEFNLPVDNRLLGLGTISGHFVFAPKNIPQGCQAGTRLIFIQDSIEMKHIKKKLHNNRQVWFNENRHLATGLRMTGL